MRSVALAMALLLLVATPVGAGEIIDVESLGIKAPVVPARFYQLSSGAWTLTVPCWEAASAWQAEANTILFGHSYHPGCGGVFNALHHAQPGLELTYGGQRWVVTDVRTGVKPAEAHWLSPSDDARLTLITCWPARSSRSRMVVIARPADGLAARSASPSTASSGWASYLYL